ncbi:Lipopolysaccharide core biosynthesis glycosyltransferase WaaE [Nymphon striatum]|nr:Lipopolysaccharide core biosynthesis glycosyltransferase WaaE [Nymphon striatum]
MKFILFCQNAYAFGIMAPIRDALAEQSEDYLWYISKKLLAKFPFPNEAHTTSILDLQYYKSDVIFVPGNEVPYYLRGVKTQIFHGLAGEKKGHFRIRHYFDLYLTQGPYFTNRFNELKEKHDNFDVVETGWPKLDIYGKEKDNYNKEKKELLKYHSTDKIILYAPTFSPSLTSAAANIRWDNLSQKGQLTTSVLNNLKSNQYSEQRIELNEMYHPYQDGRSAKRMITAIINIDEVLTNLHFADEIIIVDSFSTDGTVEQIKKRPKVQLIQRPFVNYTDQKSFAMSQASNDWVLFMDADERLTDRLKNELLITINDNENQIVAYYFYRTFMFQQKILRYSGWQSDKNFRLFRKSKVAFTQDRIVHETLVVDGKIGVLKNKLIHYSYKDYKDYKGKMIKYGQMKAQEELVKNYDPNLYHFIFRPFYKFFNHYVLRFGFLDGKKGMIISYLNALGVYNRYKELNRLRKDLK